MILKVTILGIGALLLVAVGIASVPAVAQLNPPKGTVAINAVEALTVNVTNAAITIPLSPNTANNLSTSPTTGTIITTAWVLTSSRTAVKIFIFAANPNPLSNGTNTIPATSIKISNTGRGGTYNALAAGTPFGTGLQIGPTTNITSLNQSGNRIDTIFFAIDTTFNPHLSAGTYSGSLSIQAQATP
jgi:hypothetical protein